MLATLGRRSLTLTVSENGGFIIQYYNISNEENTRPFGSGEFNYRPRLGYDCSPVLLTAKTLDEALSLVRDVCRRFLVPRGGD